MKMQQSGTLLWRIFIAIWFALVLISYWSYHPQYSVSLMLLPNASILFTLLTLCGGVWYWVSWKKPMIRGWMIYAFVILLAFIVFAMYGTSHSIFRQSGLVHSGYFLVNVIYAHGCVMLLWLAHAGLGSRVIQSLRDRYHSASFMLISLAVGLSLTTPILLVLGMTGMLKGWILWILFGGLLVWRYKANLDFLQQVFVEPISLKKVSRFTLIPVFMLFAGAATHVVITMKPWPVGFDGSLLYVNTAHLLAEYQALPQAGQAFNWELMMSMGELMFGSVSVTILLSHLAIYLCVFALYRLSRLVMSKKGGIVAVTLLYLTPTFAFHARQDEKVDLGFLFVALSILLLLLERYRDPNVNKSEGKSELITKNAGASNLFIWCVTGWLSGYSFGIKYTAIFTILGLLTYLVYKYLGTRASIGTILSGFGVLFLMGVHNFGYLDLAGMPAWIFALCGLVPGIGLLGLSARKNLSGLGGVLRYASVFVLFFISSFMPWMVNHYQQNKELTISALVQGKVTPPALVSSGKLRELRDPLDLPERKLIQTFKSFGVTLSAPQVVGLRTMLKDYHFEDGDAIQLQKNLVTVRNRMVEEILQPDQRAQVQTRMNEMGLVLDSEISDIEGTMDKIIQTMRRRSIELDSGQKSQVHDLLLGYDLQGIKLRGSRDMVSELRETIFATVLTPEQYARMRGLGSGELSVTEDGTLYRSPLFGGIQREEIRRYLGYEGGLPLYLSIPHDLTMNVNIPFSRYLDISFLILLLMLPLMLGRKVSQNIPVFLVVMIVWIVSVYSLFAAGGKPDGASLAESILARAGIHEEGLSMLILPVFEWLQKGFVYIGMSVHGVYVWMEGLSFIVVFPGMIVLGLGAFLVMRPRMSAMPKPLKNILAFGLAFGSFWFFLGNAIVWYGFVFFALLLLLVSYFYEHPEELDIAQDSHFMRRLWRGCVIASMVFSLSLFFVSATQERQNAVYIFQNVFLQHVSSSQSIEQTRTQFIPYMEDVLKLLNADTRQRIYRVGTFFNYHIAENDRRVLEDNQLGLFDQVAKRLDDPKDFVRLLKLSGFKYILFDLNTGSIDQTPEKSLQKKATSFFNLLISSPDLVPMYTDNFIYDPNVPFTKVDDFNMPGIPGFGDQVTHRGSFMLLEIK